MKIQKIISIVLSSILLTGLTVPAAQAVSSAKNFESKTFSASNGVELPYRLYIPENYSADTAIPILTFLHGAGERGSNNTAPLQTDCNLIDQIVKKPETYPCIIVVPQCGENFQWVDTPWNLGNYSADEIPMSPYLAAVKELLDSLEKEYSIDTDRRYITGYSMGGFGTWDMIMRYPRTFAAALPICGGGDPFQVSRLLDIPIRTYHGSADPAVPVDGTRAIASAMEIYEAPYFSYTEFEGAEHGIWGTVYGDQEVLDWLFAQTREASRLYWGDVDQDKTISASDALLVLQHSVQLTKLEYEDADVADVSGDCEINAADALQILQHSVELIDRFEAEK